MATSLLSGAGLRIIGWALPPLLAAALIGAAVATAAQAGCDDPGRWVPIDGGYELVGGCVAPGDFLIPDVVPPAPAVDGVEEPVQS